MFEKVEIGSHADIKEFTYVSPGVQIGDGVTVQVGSSVGPNKKLPDNTSWEGKPAKEATCNENITLNLSVSERAAFYQFWKVLVNLIICPYWIAGPFCLTTLGFIRLLKHISYDS